MGVALDAVPQDVQQLVALLRARLGEPLRSLLLFGSCLSPRTRKAGSLPDLWALLDDGSLGAVLPRLDGGAFAGRLSSWLPPLTLALRAARGERTLAKLNLIEPRAAWAELALLPDLYLAGRLSKAGAVLYARDAACMKELAALANRSVRAVATLVVKDLPQRCAVHDAVRACLALSYRAELRPEGPRKLRTLYESFADFYAARFYTPLLESAAAAGLRCDLEQGLLLDDRPARERAAARGELHSFLRRSRLRSLLRFPKQVLVYRGALSYALAKHRRARREEARG